MAGVLQYREDITKHLEFLGYSHENIVDDQESGIFDAFPHPTKNTLFVEYANYLISLQYRLKIDGLQISDEELRNINYEHRIKVAYSEEENLLIFSMFINHYEKISFGVIVDFLRGSVDSVMRKLNIYKIFIMTHEKIEKFIKLPDSQKIFEFMVYFSRFEYAIKSQGKYSNQNYSVDWSGFEKDFKDFGLNEKIKNEFKDLCIIKNPPHKFVGEEWKEIKHKSIISYIKTVRNNLFHGQKVQIFNLNQNDRDYILIIESLEILKKILEECKNSTKKEFKNIYQDFYSI